MNNDFQQNSSDQKDEFTLALEKVPCGICKESRSTICRGHGKSGGGTGGGSSGGEENTAKTETTFQHSNGVLTRSEVINSAPTLQPSNANPAEEDLEEGLEVSSIPEMKLDFKEIENLIKLGAISITNDAQNGTLVIKGIYGLTHAQNNNLQEFFNFIKSAFDQFKKQHPMAESWEHKNNTLTITITPPIIYEQFIEILKLAARNAAGNREQQKLGNNQSVEDQNDKSVANDKEVILNRNKSLYATPKLTKNNVI